MQECQIGVSPGGSIFGDVAALLRALFQRGFQIIKRCLPLAAVPAAFVVFVRLNGGIVVGDRSAHVAVPHLVQPLYFLLFAAIALAPTLLTRKRFANLFCRLTHQPATSATIFVGLTSAAVAVVDKYTVAHPYLLSDNRHVTFYIWKDILGLSPIMRRAVAPLYVASGFLLVPTLAAKQPALWVATWLLSTCAVLVPAGLVEFRYYTIPLIMLALHMEPPTVRQICCTAMAWTVVNAITVWLFLMRPFVWPDGSLARFMW